ncbi:MAG: hypothetical protein A2902_07565 [Elusimicrobia bacterium RIFCSPLOWO2_01_FULL_64_13]|nr:MAG: hypothetical protein A2636_00190 [Elusimicrobia bacterium RIFCSPHIGHO2_01_FULL_64_10]OGR94490.1 MAG: hypothetical protein A2902_07565 [Elusimicrobia bacterium RIFCSPLOWO2_01_FULL_64_13]
MPPVLVLLVCGVALVAILLLGAGWSYRALAGTLIFTGLLLFLFVTYLVRDFPDLVRDDEAMMLLGTLMIFFVLLIQSLRPWAFSYYLTPIAAASILSSLLLHPRISIVLTLVLASLLAMAHGFSFDCFLPAFLGGLAGTASAGAVRTHRDFVRCGVWVAFFQFASLLAVTIFHGEFSNDFFWGVLWTAINGLISAVIALGLLPFLESFFSRVTPMKLLELADFNQPLLKRLMVEAPGTYHHSLMMATIAQAGARAVGANELLCRVGAYYHDIGKLVKPEYFIENQGNLGYNPHGNLQPALSSLVVVSHVKEGLSLARAAKLPKEILNFIPMHHGTSRIEYFYNQAVENAEEESLKNYEEGVPADVSVGEETYRYPGPKPCSKETAILMLADSVEATARTIEDPSHQHFKDMVEKIVRRKFRDGQLADSPLTLSDLSKLEDAFVSTLTSVYHARIEYPEDEAG